MKRIHLVLLTLTAGLALLWALLFLVAGRPASTLAAPHSVDVLGDPLGIAHQRPLAQVSCTLATTTTDSLAGTDHYTYTGAAPLASYSGLALVGPGTLPRDTSQPVHDDWFRLDNAGLNYTYQIDALPDGTINYNLGMIVYNASLTPIYTDTDSASNNFARITFQATTYGPYFFKVFQLTPVCTGGTYRLSIAVTTPTPSPGADLYESNNSPGYTTAYRFPVGTSASATNANFHPPGDVDCYGFYVRNGQRYQAYTHDLSGVDTLMKLYDRSGAEIASDNNGGGGFASKIEWTASYGDTPDAYYYVCITNLVSSTSADTYDLTIAEITAATATPGPTATSVSGLDPCEPNFDFDHACIIPPNQSLNFNFISAGGGPDNDYFKIWVKPGLRFECKTSDLSPGVDPNMIFYDQNRSGIAGNDDVSPGDYNSALSYFSTYEGWLYVLVGTGNRLPTNLNASNYTLRCDVVAPGTPTPLPTNTPRPTVEPGVATATSPPNPTQPPGLTWRLLTTPPPSAAVTPAAPHFVPINLLVYYDANNDGQPGAGEGIAGISAEAYDTSTGQMLAQGFTGEQGNLTFTVASAGPVRVSVPFFGFNQLVTGEGASVYLRVAPQVLNPDSGPAEGTP